MRVLATTQPGSSIFFQMAALLCALRDAGHEVRVATSKRFEPTVRAAGLAHEPAGIDWLESALGESFPEVVEHRHDPHGALVRFVIDVFVRRTSPRLATDASALIERWKPDLLLHASNELGGPTAAKAAGVPHLMLVAGLDNWFARIAPALPGGDPGWLFERGMILAEAPAWSDHALEGLDPTWLRPVSPSQPVGDLAWLDSLPRPIVHVTLGTVFNKLGRPLLAALSQASAGVAASVVTTVGADVAPESLGTLPGNVHVHRYLALAPLLERCDAVLAHAGWGTLIACAEAGVPMGGLALGADQGYNARILERSGWGLALTPQACAPDAIAAWSQRLLGDPALRAGAARQQTALRELPSPDDVAAQLATRFG